MGLSEHGVIDVLGALVGRGGSAGDRVSGCKLLYFSFFPAVFDVLFSCIYLSSGLATRSVRYPSKLQESLHGDGLLESRKCTRGYLGARKLLDSANPFPLQSLVHPTLL